MSRMDVYKISDAIELMPALDTMTVRRILLIAYEHWLSVDGYIDPHPNRQQADKLGLKHADDLMRFMASMDRDQPIFAITDLVSTPRALKRLVRDVDRSWGRLKGEAELDDIIIVNVLLHGAERAIDFIVRHLDVARAERDRPFRDEQQGPDPIQVEWKGLLERLDHPRAVQTLVDLLGIRRLMVGRGVTGDVSPQDVRNYEPTDYFRRILAGNIVEGELRDQTVLRDVSDWRARSNDNLTARMILSTEADERYARVFEHFAPSQLTPAELPPIASDIHQRILRREAASPIFQKVPAAISVWRLMNRRLPKDRWTNWLIDEIRHALPVSLLFGSELYNWYGSTRHGILTPNGRREAREATVEAARAVYTNADSLIRTLSLDQPYALTRFIFPPPQDEPEDTVTLEELRWFANLAVDAARIAPELVVPDVVVVFGQFGSRFERGDEGDVMPIGLVQTYALDRDRFSRFFGDRTNEMLELIAGLDSDTPVVLDAQREIRQWLAEDRNANPE